MTYILHYAPDNASLIVRLALETRGLPYETRLVDRAARAQESAAYRAVNPAGLIPALETPQGAIFETGAILLWLADTHGGLGPAPGSPSRGDFLKWLFYVSNTLHPALRMTFYPELYVGADPEDQRSLRLGLQDRLRQSLDLLDAAAAAGHPWLNADAPSVIDFYLAACLRWCALYPRPADRSWFSLAQWPNLHHLCTRVDKLPCTRAAQTAEGLGPTPFAAPSYPCPPEGSAL